MKSQNRGRANGPTHVDETRPDFWSDYARILCELPDPGHTFLLWRVGDWFELYNYQADAFARLFDLHLTKRGGLAMCSVFVGEAAGYVAHLVNAGFAVAISHQSETPVIIGPRKDSDSPSIFSIANPMDEDLAQIAGHLSDSQRLKLADTYARWASQLRSSVDQGKKPSREAGGPCNISSILHTMTEAEFYSLADRIRALGYDEETAAGYSGRIGDTPEIDVTGATIVRDDSGHIIARLALLW